MKNLFNKLQGFVSNDKALSDKHLLELRRDWFLAMESALSPYKQSQHEILFTGVLLHITVPDFSNEDAAAKDKHANLLERFVAAYDQFPPFDAAAKQYLSEARFSIPPHFSISAVINPNPDELLQKKLPEGEYVWVELQKKAPEPAQAWLLVEGGKANEIHYFLDGKKEFNVGRMAVVTDKRGGILRQNTIAFYGPDELPDDAFNAGINKSISRRHAKVRYDSEKRRFVWINEDGMTRLMRASFKEPLILRAGQQVPLEEDDLLYLGKSTAALRFKRADAE